jgi:uncharacterized membrane protein
MTYEWPLYLCLFISLWSAIVGGVFSAFSEFIMSALRKASPTAGIEVMQQINRTVIRTQFVAGILLIGPLSILATGFALWNFEGAALVTLILASVVYLSSVLFMTMLGNVLMNNKLDRLGHTSNEASLYWTEYGRVWTRLNHFRSVGSIVTAILYGAASLILISSGQV